MTNADYFLKDEMKQAFIDELASYFEMREKNLPRIIIIDYLNKKRKPTLTEDERVILRNIAISNIRAIGRKDSALYVRESTGETTYFINYMFPDLFQFIKERRRI